jgi:hypothetical protein
LIRAAAGPDQSDGVHCGRLSLRTLLSRSARSDALSEQHGQLIYVDWLGHMNVETGVFGLAFRFHTSSGIAFFPRNAKHLSKGWTSTSARFHSVNQQHAVMHHHILKWSGTDHCQYFIGLIQGDYLLNDIPSCGWLRPSEVIQSLNDPKQWVILNRPFGQALKPNPGRREIIFVVHKTSVSIRPVVACRHSQNPAFKMRRAHVRRKHGSG